ncbi:O-antigen ligase family protein [Cryobacterium sp. Y82]|uniref:O-antigen ligase family protein n=1 Tax=Cryobacterium sp. Y82 TaxID=2045017 RepID=UPI000CE3CACE|nr:O-antigen ligase family protein [Cryobacterium sp. Y82]
MTSVWILFVATGAGAAFWLAVLMLRRWPILGAVCMALTVLVAWEFPQLPPLFIVAGNTFYPLDLLSAVMLTVASFRVREIVRNVGWTTYLWVVIGLVLTVGFARGLGEFTPGIVLNELRFFLYPFAALFWGLSLRFDTLPKEVWTRGGIVLGWSLVAVGLAHWTVYGLGGADEFVDPASGVEQTSRILVSGQALTLLLCAVIVGCDALKRRQTLSILSSTVFLTVVILTQQRAAWLALLAAGLALFIHLSVRVRWFTFLIVAYSATIVILLVAVGGLQVLGGLGESATNAKTYDGRVGGWLYLVQHSADDGLINVIFGSAVGSGYGRFESATRWVEYSPHNWYIMLYLRTGLVGLALLAVILVELARTAVRKHTMPIETATISAILVFGWAYSWPWYTLLIFAWASSRILSPTLNDRSLPPQLSLQPTERRSHALH